MKISNLLKVLLFSCVILLSCEEDIGTRETETPMYDVSNPHFDKYVNEYKRLAGLKGITFNKKKLTVNFVDGFKKQKKEVVGICEYFGDDRVEILIKRSFYEEAIEREREVLMYHELTHCMCYRDHEYKGTVYKKGKENPPGTMFEDGCPKTLIYPTVLTIYCSQQHWDYYLDEMFENCPGSDNGQE
jgi:hypothetical protein